MQDHNEACSRGCNFPFATLHSWTRNTTYALSARQCAAATTNWGVRPPQGIDLSNIVVIGGSISCNRNVGNRTPAADGDVSAFPKALDEPAAVHGWPRQLERILNQCVGSKVSVVNLCRGSAGTDYWLSRLRLENTPRYSLQRANTHSTMRTSLVADSLQRATVVLVESAINDDDSVASEVLAEAMVRLLLDLPRRPFLLWAAGGFNLEWHTSAELRQLRVVREYGVGQISVLNALRPSRAAATQAFIKDVYFQDGVHPTKLGHRLLASIVAAHILQQRRPDTDAMESALVLPSAPPDQLAGPFVMHRESLKRLRRSQLPPRFAIDLSDRALCVRGGAASPQGGEFARSHGFSFLEDVPGKCGLIATKPGSRTSWLLPANVTSAVLGYLSSYAHNGRCQVKLMRGQPCGSLPSTTSSDSNQTGAAIIVDTLADDPKRRVSVYSEASVSATGPSTECSRLEVRVLKTSTRVEHKVKLLQVIAD